jgi:hypothetical protein
MLIPIGLSTLRKETFPMSETGKETQLLKASIALFFITTWLGCASSSSSLDPKSLSEEEGAFGGKITVFVNGEKRTGDCYAKFTDDNDDKKAYINLDETGWVFSQADQGTTYLSSVDCKGPGFPPHRVIWKSDSFNFKIRPGKQFAYFGHLVIRIQDDGISAAWLLLGAAGVSAASSHNIGQGTLEIRNESRAAQTEFQKRYPDDQQDFRIAYSVQRPSNRMPASQ